MMNPTNGEGGAFSCSRACHEFHRQGMAVVVNDVLQKVAVLAAAARMVTIVANRSQRTLFVLDKLIFCLTY
ncbi:hypothetical protein FHR87_002656 [Azomonas macrocytogenes]|uniref:Uncharacterized protein n=1 Tax=Azomonas macrocytogenes TaxID=69962 RepID=A0A839T3Y2_AZOMA|nr:hypothetical protein [Azomonas macrocytogenes]